MGKKKPFIDKKNASTYHVLYRSQRDVDEAGGVILWPSPHNKKETDERVLSSSSSSMGEWKQQVAEAGILDDYDYDQHLKPIAGTGVYLGKDGSRGNGTLDPRSSSVTDHVREVSRQLDSIALTSDCMDEDIAQALFGDFEEGDFEEIQDDFCLAAAEEPEEDEEPFDFDAHIRGLMEKAAKNRDDGIGISLDQHGWGKHDQAFFSKAKALNEEDMVVPSLNEEEERALCERFEQTLAEYDSDEVGELESEDIRGDVPFEEKHVASALDEFLEEKKDEIFVQGTHHLPSFRAKRGNGFHTLAQTNEDDAPEPAQQVLAQAKEYLALPRPDLPPEEILIDGKSYFSERERNPWDCESILSTYSNVDNNPVTIENTRRRRRRKKKQTIVLSNKTGLPLGVLHDEEEDDDLTATVASVNRGEGRNKKESAAEKKRRKQAIKQERAVSRMQKKMMKDAFREEFTKAQSNDAPGDVAAGQPVFRFS